MPVHQRRAVAFRAWYSSSERCDVGCRCRTAEKGNGGAAARRGERRRCCCDEFLSGIRLVALEVFAVVVVVVVVGATVTVFGGGHRAVVVVGDGFLRFFAPSSSGYGDVGSM